MLRVKIKEDSHLHIADCPVSGLAAVQFRQDNGLPLRPDNHLPIDLDIEAESIVKKWPKHTTSGADLEFLSCLYISSVPYPTIVPVPLAVRLAADPSDVSAVGELVAVIINAIESKSARDQAAQNERDRESAASEAQTKADREQYQIRHAAETARQIVRLDAFLTDGERFLAQRNRLKIEDVMHRLEVDAETELADKLATCPKPGGYEGGVTTIDSGDEAGSMISMWTRTHWNVDWVPAIQFIEHATGHPVREIVTDCIDFHSHVNVAWQDEPLHVRIRFEKPEVDNTEDES